jgi:hypothetical protein
MNAADDELGRVQRLATVRKRLALIVGETIGGTIGSDEGAVEVGPPAELGVAVGKVGDLGELRVCRRSTSHDVARRRSGAAVSAATSGAT